MNFHFPGKLEQAPAYLAHGIPIFLLSMEAGLFFWTLPYDSTADATDVLPAATTEALAAGTTESCLQAYSCKGAIPKVTWI